MAIYERILVPTDGSAASRKAAKHAIALASEQGAEIHAIYVINSASFSGLTVESSWEGVSEMLREEGQDAVDEVVELATEADVRVETTLLTGTPSQEIVRYAENQDCDLIVMGTHGRGGIDRLLLGSVAERVVRASDVPVLTVREAE
ncbi:MAG: universal stress protein [Halobacteriaceae archaeon]